MLKIIHCKSFTTTRTLNDTFEMLNFYCFDFNHIDWTAICPRPMNCFSHWPLLLLSWTATFVRRWIYPESTRTLSDWNDEAPWLRSKNGRKPMFFALLLLWMSRRHEYFQVFPNSNWIYQKSLSVKWISSNIKKREFLYNRIFSSYILCILNIQDVYVQTFANQNLTLWTEESLKN